MPDAARNCGKLPKSCGQAASKQWRTVLQQADFTTTLPSLNNYLAQKPASSSHLSRPISPAFTLLESSFRQMKYITFTHYPQDLLLPIAIYSRVIERTRL